MPTSSPKITFDRGLSYFLIFAFASGTLAHLLPAVLPVTRVTTDGLLFVLNGLVLYAIYRRHQDRRLFVWLFIAYWFTFAMEALGVATGAIFGEYAYGPTMWFQWLGVPFVIALNWCVLTLACNDLAGRVFGKYRSAEELPLAAAKSHTASQNRISHILTAALAAVLTALYDIAIEPVAIALDYWQWGGGEIPLQNYLAWAAIAFIISLPLQLMKIRFSSPVLLVYLSAQLFFFLVLNVML
jgi:putative membrane protein